MPLFWFHAFRRDVLAEYISVLRTGPTPNLAPGTHTRANEAVLGIAPPRVYAYLGRTSEAFGQAALAVPFNSIGGDASPFDTGGLVHVIWPVSTWSDPDKKAYLNGYSWSHLDLNAALSTYPGDTADNLRVYLDATHPGRAGPHELWAERPTAAIWEGASDWRSWTWELRVPGTISTGDSLISWSCPAALFAQFLEEAARAPATEREWFTFAASRYVRGGVSEMLRQMRAQQESAA